MSNIPLTDLRIGNIVYTYDNQQDNIDQECIITAINDNGTLGFRWPDEDYNCNAPLEDFEGVPISEEWLERFGFLYCDDPNFDKHANAKMFYSKGIQIGIRVDDLRCPSFYMGYPIRGIVYIHQLQNIFYFLTGTELTLKQ